MRDIKDIAVEVAELVEKKNLEIWVDINNYEGFYQVSNHGNVKSLKRAVWSD